MQQAVEMALYSKKNKIVALHGFLGEPHDFSCLALPNLQAFHIFRMPLCSFEQWATRFNRLVGDQSIIMGYSLGARLALHCLLKDPKKFKAAVIMAAHPGLCSEDLRFRRYMSDKIWSTRFLSEPWPELMHAWQNQEVFKSSAFFVREEANFNRESLSLALKYFSLGAQDYLGAKLALLEIPILWLQPEEEANKMAHLKLKHPRSCVVYMQGGHRFMMSKPKATRELIINFVRLLE